MSDPQIPHHTFTAAVDLPVPVEDLYAWHARPGAFERLVPPWENISVVRSDNAITDGSELVMRIHKGPTWVTWVAHHSDHIPKTQFVDTQVQGPFGYWRHRHLFEPTPGGSRLTDEIHYALPVIPTNLPTQGLVEPMLARMFRFRHRRTLDDLTRHARFKDKPPMKIAISGASGLIGSALKAFLTTGGHQVFSLVRGKPGPNQIAWDPARNTIDSDALEGMDAVIHLAGESISGRWTPEKKRKILESRTRGTELLARTLARLAEPPRVFVSASAIGYYGNRGDAPLDETSSRGEGFLAEVCELWEDAARPAENAGIRVVHPRIGIVLSPSGGALKELLLPFKLGAGGPVGDGRQYMSWITLDDLLGAFLHVIQNDDLRGPVNFTAPNAVQNRDFARTLAGLLNRPGFLPLPATAVKLAMGEMGQALLLDGARVLPDKLQRSGFQFLHPTLETGLRAELGL